MNKKQLKVFKIINFVNNRGVINNLKWFFNIKGIGDCLENEKHQPVLLNYSKIKIKNVKKK